MNTKKSLYTLSILLLCAMAPLTLVACAGENGQEIPPSATSDPGSSAGEDSQISAYKGKVVENTGGALLICGAEDNAGSGELYHLSLDGLALSDAGGQSLTAAAVEPGAIVEVGFDGMILETFPAGFSHPSSLRVLSQSDDLVGLYLEVIDDLYQTDEGLNEGIEIIALDLTDAENLSGAEKSALLYLVGNHAGVETREATCDGLVEEGLIDSQRLSFEKGLLFSFSDMKFGEQSFTFDVQKWRGGDGAYFFADCEAKKSGGAWSYSVGQEMIS